MTRLRNTDRLRTRIFWVLVAFGAAPMTVALVYSGAPWLVMAAVGSVLASVLLGWIASGFLVAPIHELARRMSVKNYGEPEEPEVTQPLNLNDAGVDLAANLSTHYVRLLGIRDAPLPAELQTVERLARAGRVTELALESVKKDLFRHLSHQLKSPMALLRAHIQAIRVGSKSGDLAAIESSAKSMEDVTMSVSSLVEQMLSMAWVERLGERGPLKDKVNLSAALMQLISVRNSIPLERAVVLTTSVDASLWVRGEKQLLQEMLLALVDNAIRYSPPNGEVRVEAKRVQATKTVVVRVVDHGPGIPPSERDNVFEPFYGSTGQDEKGVVTYGTRRHRAVGDGLVKTSHGLGLSLVRAVAKLHGAQVALRTGPEGRGLSVEVLMAATTAPAPVA